MRAPRNGTRDARWRGALELLSELRRAPGLTRVEAARRAGLSSGSATEITTRLRAIDLVSEVPAPITGRGRPTTTLQPHPRGPLVVAVDVRHEDWRCAIVPLDGRPQMVIARPHGSSDSSALMQDIAAVLARLRRRHGRRLRAVSVAVAGTVERGRLVQVATLGWGAVDLETILGGLDIPLLIGNDATLAGLAEARHGAGVGSRTVLHLTVEVGIGGVLVVDQAPVAGSSGAGGEYGHLPFGDLRLRCPCGARGCWDLEVDGRALARHLGEPPPADSRRYARLVLAWAAEEGDGQARRAVRTVAVALASGIAGLVNAHDPDVVTLGALAGEIRAVARPEFDAAYMAGLMGFRRRQPTPLVPAALGEEGALVGAAAAALDVVLSEQGLRDWAAVRAS